MTEILTADILKELITILIRLTVIYVFLGVICSSVVELISDLFQIRYIFLRKAIYIALGKKLDHAFWNHGLIKSLGPFPKYIPLWFFPIIVADLQKKYLDVSDSTQKDFIDVIQLLKDQVSDHSSKNVLIEKWFRSILESASSRYRTIATMMLSMCALLLALILRFDTIQFIGITFKGYFSLGEISKLNDWMQFILQIGPFFESIGFGYILTAIFISVGSLVVFNILTALRNRGSGK